MNQWTREAQFRWRKGRNLRPCVPFEASARARTVTGMHAIQHFGGDQYNYPASQLLYRSSLGRNRGYGDVA